MPKKPLARREKSILAALKRASNWIDASPPGPESNLDSWATIHDDLLGVIQRHDPAWVPGKDE
jgi:hypothetical protein